jgi:hypothetical protein
MASFTFFATAYLRLPAEMAAQNSGVGEAGVGRQRVRKPSPPVSAPKGGTSVAADHPSGHIRSALLQARSTSGDLFGSRLEPAEDAFVNLVVVKQREVVCA